MLVGREFVVIVKGIGLMYPTVTVLSALIVTLQVVPPEPDVLSHPVQPLKLLTPTLAGAVSVTTVLLL